MNLKNCIVNIFLWILLDTFFNMSNFINPVIYTGLDPRVQQKVKRICKLSSTDVSYTFEAIQEVFDITYEELIGLHRKQHKAFSRHAFCYVIKKSTKYSLEEIGDFLGGRNHSTVLHSIRAAGNLMDTDKYYNSKVRTCMEIVKRKQLGVYNSDISYNEQITSDF